MRPSSPTPHTLHATPFASGWCLGLALVCAGLLVPSTAAGTPLAALQPNIALTPEQLAIAARRSRLPMAAQLECSALDTRLPTLERAAKRAKPEQKPDAENALNQARQRYAALRC